MNAPQPGDTFSLHAAWRLPDNHRLRVTFAARVEALERDKNRLRCRLLSVQAAGGTQPEENVPPHYLQRIMALVGKRAWVPLVALEGTVLPLRLATLTGEHPFFFD